MSNAFHHDGDSYQSQFEPFIDKRIKSKAWFSYADIHDDWSRGKESDIPISKREGINGLKKAIYDTFNHIRNRTGQVDCIEEEGNNRKKRYRYVGADPDPLADYFQGRMVEDVKEFWQFCQDSAGFFPESWLDYFFKNTKNLLDLKKIRLNGERALTSSLDREVKNIELLPRVYKAIKRKKVLLINYHDDYDQKCKKLEFHPHLVKEFNGRWFLFGFSKGETPEIRINIALDRIEDFSDVPTGIPYQSAPKDFYKNLLENIVGVTPTNGHVAKDVHIRAHSEYMFNLTDTKKLHRSQKTVIPFGQHKDGKYGEFTVHVEINNEFIGSVLQMGSDLEVVAPDDVRKIFAERVAEMMRNYQ